MPHCLAAREASTGTVVSIHGLIAYSTVKCSGGHMRYVLFRGKRSVWFMNKSVGRLHSTKQRLFLCDGGGSLRMDVVDQRIVALLVADARASFAEIGAKVSLSAPAVK